MRWIWLWTWLALALPGVARAQMKACTTVHQCTRGESCILGKCIYEVPPETCTPGDSWFCYDGGEQTINVGDCRQGFQFCSAGKEFSSCLGQVLPRAEVCDREDNDCDGLVDEGLQCSCTPGDKRECYPHPTATLDVGICTRGIQYCGRDHEWGECAGHQGPEPEVCDRIDNDCDGQADEDEECACEPGALRTCYTGEASTRGVGTCTEGQQACLTDRTWSRCFEEQGPVDELCDGRDNDCDGTVDEGLFAGCGDSTWTPRPAGEPVLVPVP